MIVYHTQQKLHYQQQTTDLSESSKGLFFKAHFTQNQHEARDISFGLFLGYLP